MSGVVLESNPVVICPCPWQREHCDGEERLDLVVSRGVPESSAGLVHLKTDLATATQVEMVSCAIFSGHRGGHVFGSLTPDQQAHVGRRVVLRQRLPREAFLGECPDCGTSYIAELESLTPEQYQQDMSVNA